MAKKRLTADTASNPLTESAFFKSKAKTERSGKPNDPENRTENEPQSKVGRPRKKRATTRHSFEFYKDQLTSLRKLRAQRELETGQSFSLSDVVREAIDWYLEQQENKEKKLVE